MRSLLVLLPALAACDPPCDGGTWYVDADGDGVGGAVAACEPGPDLVPVGGDCNDGDPAFTEPRAVFVDADGDGFGAHAEPVVVCATLEGYADKPVDCDDDDPDIGHIVDLYPDSDDDGYGDATAEPVLDCPPRDGYADNALDCDDDDPGFSPEAKELCDGVDRNCDGWQWQGCEWTQIDEVAALSIYGEHEGDSVGWGLALGDIDLDGMPELLVGAPVADHWSDGVRSGALAILPAQFTGVQSFHTQTTYLAGDPSEAVSLGLPIASPADFTGDGLPDIATAGILSEPNGYTSGAVYLFHGPFPEGVRSTATAWATWFTEYAWGATGRRTIHAGDTNGDGLDDFAFSMGTDTGAVAIIHGPARQGRFDALAEADALISGSGDGGGIGADLHRADFNGDGLDDLAIGADRDDTGNYLAGAAFIALAPHPVTLDMEDAWAIFRGQRSQGYAGEELAVGDLDDDGSVDLAVGEATQYIDSGTVYIFTELQPGELDLADAPARIDSPEVSIPNAMAVVGQPGKNLLVVGSLEVNGATYNTGEIRVFEDAASGTSEWQDEASRVFSGVKEWTQLGDILVATEDLDGDGVGELLAGAWNWWAHEAGDREGAAYLVMGADLL